jgi:hypothetical protein
MRWNTTHKVRAAGALPLFGELLYKQIGSAKFLQITEPKIILKSLYQIDKHKTQSFASFRMPNIRRLFQRIFS